MNEQNETLNFTDGENEGKAVEERVLSLMTGSHSSLKALAENMGLSANYSDLLLIKSYYVKQEPPTVSELYFLDSVLKVRKSSPAGYLFADNKITDRKIADAYIHAISALNKSFPQRRPVPPSAEELIHLPVGAKRKARPVTAPASSKGRDDLSVKDARGRELFSVHGECDLEKGHFAPPSSAFIMLTPAENTSEDVYPSALTALFEDERLSGIKHFVLTVSRFGLAVTLSTVAEGIFVDPARLPDYTDGSLPASMSEGYVGRRLIVADKSTINAIEEAAADHGLCATYFAKATATGNFTVNRELSGALSIPCSLLTKLAYSPEHSVATLANEDLFAGYIQQPILFEHSDPAVIASGHDNVKIFKNKVISVVHSAGDDGFFAKGLGSVIDSAAALVAYGVPLEDITLTVRYTSSLSGLSEKDLGNNLSMILGAYEARLGLSLPEVDSKTVYAEDVPTSVTCLAYAKAREKDVSAQFTAAGNKVYFLSFPKTSDGMIDLEAAKATMKRVGELHASGKIRSALAVSGTLSSALSHMSSDKVEVSEKSSHKGYAQGILVECSEKISGKNTSLVGITAEKST